MTTLIILAVILTLVLFYVLRGRDWLKTKPWTQGFFAWVEPYEIFLFKKSRTILFARLKIFTGVLLTALTQMGAIDLSPLIPFVPEKYQGLVQVAFNLLPLTITMVGMMDERLRNETTTPIEIVALAEKDVTPAVAEAVAVAGTAKEVAVAVVVEAKAEGTV